MALKGEPDANLAIAVPPTLATAVSIARAVDSVLSRTQLRALVENASANANFSPSAYLKAVAIPPGSRTRLIRLFDNALEQGVLRETIAIVTYIASEEEKLPVTLCWTGPKVRTRVRRDATSRRANDPRRHQSRHGGRL